jgi:hypothetical protein
MVRKAVPLRVPQDTDYWLKRARSIRSLAEREADPEGRDGMRRIAETYEHIAETVRARKLNPAQ